MTGPNPRIPHESTELSANCLSTPQRPPADGLRQPFVSKMTMHSQFTSAATIEEELAVIRGQHDVSDQDKIVYDDEGWDSRVYIVNGGSICYKFPRSSEVMASYGREIIALNMIANLSTGMRTQRFKTLDPESRFFSYYGLAGTQLSELMATIDLSEKQRIGSEIGAFLRVLHARDLDDAPVVTVKDEVEEYKAKYQLALPAVEASFSHEEQSAIAEFFWDYMPEEMERLGGATRLCHGDLGSYNVIIGVDGVPGIIDFGNLGYYDQSKDFIDFGDDDVFDAVCKAYGDSPLLRAKAAIRMIALPAIDLVYYMGKNDKHGVDITTARLRSLLPTLPYNQGGVS